jgi:hypothetical protein
MSVTFLVDKKDYELLQTHGEETARTNAENQ